MDLAPGTRIDRYVIEQLIGRGGMAVVYRVRHAQLGSAHALKVLTLQSDAIQERTSTLAFLSTLTDGQVLVYCSPSAGVTPANGQTKVPRLFPPTSTS